MHISGYVNELIRKLHKKYPNKERSGIARVQKRDGYYEVTDIRFPKQSNMWVETEMKDGWLEALLEDIFTTNPEQLVEWKCWLHSHHSMWCFRSGTDETAKRSFNDGNLDYRWSIVTAYDAKGINYKCALNVFKPVNMEFNIPVKQEPFDLAGYMKAFGWDYETYSRAYKTLENDRDEKLLELQQTYTPNQSDIDQMISIFNVEGTPDDITIITKLLTTERNSSKNLRKNIINDTFADEVEELDSYFEVDYFSSKIKELEDNIISSVYNYGSPIWYRAPWLFDPEDTKYKNNTGNPFTHNMHGYERDDEL